VVRSLAHSLSRGEGGGGLIWKERKGKEGKGHGSMGGWMRCDATSGIRKGLVGKGGRGGGGR
jgi:hypothetical protein